MKYQMSAQQSDSLSYAVFGVITGIMQYVRGVNINIHLFSLEWAVTSIHAIITAGFCAGVGWVAKKIAELGYNSIVQYFRDRKNKQNE
jgi:TPP-dependent pyruvate/acetoin dehydrogenase alpha subunit